MRIQILGTAAAEAWPGLFCGCDTCRRARAAGGPDHRSRASIQIDDIYKIDFPPDSYYHSVRFGLEFSRLKHLFFTHSHHDHIDVDELAYVRPPFGHNLEDPPVMVYGNKHVLGTIESRFHGVELPIKMVPVEAFEPVGAGRLVFTPIAAKHKPDEEALNYVVGDGSKAFLYASDTGEYDEPTREFLKGTKLDLLIVECTQGKNPGPAKWHMSFPAVLALRDTLAAAGSITRDTPVVITHFSHNIGMLHADLVAAAEPEGITVAYDGIALEV